MLIALSCRALAASLLLNSILFLFRIDPNASLSPALDSNLDSTFILFQSDLSLAKKKSYSVTIRLWMVSKPLAIDKVSGRYE
jgi:hypothetical protein